MGGVSPIQNQKQRFFKGFDLPLPSDQAEARVIFVGLSARMFEQIAFNL